MSPVDAAARRGPRGSWLAGLLLAALLAAMGGPAAARASDPAGEPLLVLLEPRADSGVRGEAALLERDGLTLATVTILAGDGPYLPYLRRGSCERFREHPAIPLALASAGAPSTTTIDLPLDELRGAFVIALYEVGGDLASLLDPANSRACGRIGPAAGEETDVTPPVSGIGLPGEGAVSTRLATVCAALAGIFGLLGLRERRVAARAVAVERRSTAATRRLQRYV